MANKIHPCLWFNGQAKAAASFYTSIFNNSKITADTPMVVNFEIEGFKIMGLNGGPMFTINPSISLFVTCKSEAEIDNLYAKLLQGGKTMMALDKYPWAEKYAFLSDQFGVVWQLMLTTSSIGMQKIYPSILFVGKQFGNANAAIAWYASIFSNAQIHPLTLYKAGEEAPEGYLKFGHFELNGSLFAAMDGAGNHAFQFNEAVSLVLECANQNEIDYYWEKLTANGGAAGNCGWLKDSFGISWQIIPSNLGQLMGNPSKAGRAMQALMQMGKIDIAALENA
ncbi:MAG: VOC family protein [Flavobacterium sp.]|nr:VOC family protein [Flavobacterium sp.]